MGSSLLPTISTDTNDKTRAICPFARKAKIAQLDLGGGTFQKLSAYDPKIIQMIIDYCLHKDGIDSYAVGLPLPVASIPITYKQFADHYRDVTGFFADMCYISEVVCYLGQKSPQTPITTEEVLLIIKNFQEDTSFQVFEGHKNNMQTDCIRGQQTIATKKILRSLEMSAKSQNGRWRGHTIYKGPWYGRYHPRYNPTPVLVMLHGSVLDIEPRRTVQVREDLSSRLNQDWQEYIKGLSPEKLPEILKMLEELQKDDLVGMYGAEGLIPIPTHLDIRVLNKVLKKPPRENNDFEIDHNHDLVCQIGGNQVKFVIKNRDGQIVFDKNYTLSDILEDIGIDELAPSICTGICSTLHSRDIHIDGFNNNGFLYNEITGYIKARLQQ